MSKMFTVAFYMIIKNGTLMAIMITTRKMEKRMIDYPYNGILLLNHERDEHSRKPAT